MPVITALSLGWGVQSWTMAAMSALGDLPKIDVAIHSDTTFERKATYAFAETWTPWLEERGIPVVTVSDPRATHILKDSSRTPGQAYTIMPVFTVGVNGKRGKLRRQCTSRWKIEPLHAWLGQELKRRNIRPRSRPAGAVEQWLGISMDEWERMKDSQVDWITNRYPLIELRMTRDDCLAYLSAQGLPSPGKSACVQCPFHSRRYWQDMKRENGPDWHSAVKADEELRRTGNRWFLHSDRIPLVEAVTVPVTAGGEFDEDNEPSCDSGHCFL